MAVPSVVPAMPNRLIGNNRRDLSQYFISLGNHMHHQIAYVAARLRANALVNRKKEARFIKQLCAGEAEAWATLVEQWSPRLYSYFTYNMVSEADTQRLVQHIMSELVGELVGASGFTNLAVLIYSVAYQHMLHFRRQRAKPTAAQQRLLEQPAEGNFRPRLHFLTNFRQLRDETQQILLLYHLCEMSVAEIAQIVDQSEERLAKTLRQAQCYLQINTQSAGRWEPNRYS